MEIKLNEWQKTQNGTKYRVVNKYDSKFMKFLGKLLFFNKGFMDDYVTTIGRTIYTPDGKISEKTLKHELKHVEQWSKWNVLFSLSYIFVLPCVWTMRAYWEKQAYEISIREQYKSTKLQNIEYYKMHIIDQFTSSQYLWMWPFKKSMSKWFDKIIADCVKTYG